MFCASEIGKENLKSTKNIRKSERFSRNDPRAVPNPKKIVRNGPDDFFGISEAFWTSKVYPTRNWVMNIWASKMVAKRSRKAKKREQKRLENHTFSGIVFGTVLMIWGVKNGGEITKNRSRRRSESENDDFSKFVFSCTREHDF